MKRLFIALAMLVTMSTTINAMSYEQARQQALFLTDKMAYELNLTEEQYEAAFEVNLDYLMRMYSAPIGSAGTWTSAISCWTGSGTPISQQHISIVHSTGRLAIGTSASTPAIPTATSSTSDAHTSTPSIAVATVGTATADAVGITDAPSDVMTATMACATATTMATTAEDTVAEVSTTTVVDVDVTTAASATEADVDMTTDVEAGATMDATTDAAAVDSATAAHMAIIPV